jgi:hypothetical protein
MIRRLLVVFAVLAATLVGAAPVSASAGTVTQTVHFSSMDPFLAFIPCSSLAGFIQVHEDNGNGVFHFAANSNGFWATGTYEGDVQIQPATNVVFDANGNPVSWDIDTSGTRPSAQGHVADWFGVSVNRTVVVEHDTVNAQVTTNAGEAISFHAVGHIQMTTTTPPVITHQFFTATCS